MNKNNVILVDENDVKIGVMEKFEAHQKSLLHRAISVFIFNSKNEWLLQKRAFGKYHSGGLWSNSACSHPFDGEPNIDAANRRLFEEIGLKTELRWLFKFIYKVELDNNLSEHELDHIYLGVSDELPKLNKEEAVDFKYLSTNDLIKDLNENPENYTEWFKMLVPKVKQYL